MSAVFEWRSEYKADLVETEDGDLEVVTIVTILDQIILIIILLIISTKDFGLHVFFTNMFGNLQYERQVENLTL